MALAIDVCTESTISPRISFSHDLDKAVDALIVTPEDNHPQRLDFCLLDSSSDFVFSTSNVFAQQLSSADELFSDGKIVPMEVQQAANVTNGNIQPWKSARSYSLPASNGCLEKKRVQRLKDFLLTDFDTDNDEENTEKPHSKSFCQFTRSCSLNSETTPGKGFSRSLHFLSRRNSTGSVPSAKLTKETQKQSLQKQSSVSSRRSCTSSSSSNSTTAYYYFNSYQKSPSKKKFGSCNNGVKISPVLNLPQSYVPKSSYNFLGFGSLFSNGKIKRKI